MIIITLIRNHLWAGFQIFANSSNDSNFQRYRAAKLWIQPYINTTLNAHKLKLIPFKLLFQYKVKLNRFVKDPKTLDSVPVIQESHFIMQTTLKTILVKIPLKWVLYNCKLVNKIKLPNEVGIGPGIK